MRLSQMDIAGKIFFNALRIDLQFWQMTIQKPGIDC